MPINLNKTFKNVILLKDVLIPKLLNNPFSSCSFINLDFLLLHTAHFDNKTNLPFFVFINFAYFLYLFYTLNNVNMFVLYYY